MCHVFVKKGAPNTNYIGALKITLLKPLLTLMTLIQQWLNLIPPRTDFSEILEPTLRNLFPLASHMKANQCMLVVMKALRLNQCMSE